MPCNGAGRVVSSRTLPSPCPRVSARADESERTKQVTNLNPSKMKKTYHHIVFLQGQEADETLQIINEKGCEAAVDHLVQWDNCEYHEQSDSPSAGSGDYTYTSECGHYLLTYNPRIGYAGLEYVETEEPQGKDPEQKYWDACQTWAERHSHEDEDLW